LLDAFGEVDGAIDVADAIMQPPEEVYRGRQNVFGSVGRHQTGLQRSLRELDRTFRRGKKELRE